MDIFHIDKLTDDMMHLSHNGFYAFVEAMLNKDLCELFRAQSIRDMLSLASVTADDLTQILDFDIIELNHLRKALGFVSTDGKFHLRLGFRNLLDRLLSLVKSKQNSSVSGTQRAYDGADNEILQRLIELWEQAPSSSNDAHIPILYPWIKNIFENIKKSKNNFSYDNHIQQFALILFIFGGRNCYEFLRLNLRGALPHICSLESLIRNKEIRMIECEFRFELLAKHLPSDNNRYVFSSEDSTSSICRVDYDAETNTFIGFSSPLANGIPQPNTFRTDDFRELEKWFEEYDKSKFINIHMMQPISPGAPPIILSAYGSNNKATAVDVLQRWLYIYERCLLQGIRVIGFSADGDARYLKAMRLCARFFAQLSNLDIFKDDPGFSIHVPVNWTWFLMKPQQLLLFMQDPVHLATKFRNRLLSEVASLTMGHYSINIQHLFDLLEEKSKIDHNLMRSDVNPKDRQNFASCVKVSSEMVLKLLDNVDEYQGTYVYLSLLRLIISSLIERSTSIADRLCQIWTVVFTCRFWRAWIKHARINRKSNTTDSTRLTQLKMNMFITKPTYWCIEINAHTLLSMTLLVIRKQLPIDAMNTYMFNSQTCENTFRVARALSGVYSSATNFTVKSFLKRSEKISIINSIKARDGRVGAYRFLFPQHHKSHKDTSPSMANPIKEVNLTELDIDKIMKKAFDLAKDYVTKVKMTPLLKEKKLYSMSELSQFVKINLSSSSKLTDYVETYASTGGSFVGNNSELSDDNDDDEDDDEDDDDEEDEVEANDEVDDEDEEEEDDSNVLSIDLDEVQRRNFQGCRIYDKVNPKHVNKYFRIHIGTSFKYIHKQTACWLLSNDKNRLSSDRLLRVRNYQR